MVIAQADTHDPEFVTCIISMASLEGLPEELLIRLTRCLERSDLATVRLVNTRLNRIATEQLFRCITLHAHWVRSLDDDEDERHSVDSDREATWTWGGRDEAFHMSSAIDTHSTQADELTLNDLQSPNAMSSVSIGYELDDATVSERPDSQSVLQDEEDPQSNSRHQEGSMDADLQDDLEQGLDFAAVEETESPRLGFAFVKRHVPLWAGEYFPGPFDYSAQSFKNILLEEGLRKYVQEVQVYTCASHCVSKILEALGRL